MTAGRAQLFILAHYPGPAWHAGVPFAEQPGIVDHIAFMRSLTERRLMVLGGPYAGSGEDGDPVGMAIIRATDLAEAETLAAEDASVHAGLLRVRTRLWTPRMGSALEM